MAEQGRPDIKPVDYWVLKNLERFDRLRQGRLRPPAGEATLDPEKTARDLGYEDPACRARMGR